MSTPPRQPRPRGLSSEDVFEKKEEEKYYDKYGFETTKDEAEQAMAASTSKENREKLRTENKRLEKWMSMLNNWQKTKSKKAKKLKSRIRKGIPEAVRGQIWMKISGAEELMKENPGEYERLLRQMPDREIAGVINRDLNRTFPTHDLYNANKQGTRELKGTDLLKNVLYAYAVYDREVGYCQGMGFIATLFLLYTREEEAFWLLVAVLRDDGMYALRNTYVPGLPLLKQRYFEMDFLVKQFFPNLHKQFKEYNVEPALYASKWFMTGYAYDFPFEAVVRIWDCYLSEGTKILFRVALQCLKNDEHIFMQLNDERLFSESQKIKDRIKMPDLIDDCLKLKLSRSHIENATRAYIAQEKKMAERKARNSPIPATG